MHCSSVSKCLAPGYRIGWAAPGRFAQAVARHKLTTTLTTAAPTQAALATYLEQGGYDRHLRQLRGTLAAQQATFVQGIAKHFPAGTRATRPAGGYFLWVELPEYCDALDIHRYALSHGVSVAPGPMFSAAHAFNHCLRLNYGHSGDPRTETALATVGRLATARSSRQM